MKNSRDGWLHTSRLDHMMLKQLAYSNYSRLRLSRIILLALAYAIGPLLFTASSGRAQESADQSATENSSQSLSDGSTHVSASFDGSSDSSDDRSTAAAFSNLNTQGTSLSSDQIIQILEQNPDLLADVKEQVVERLQQQGTQIQAGDISDEMLYGQISTNAGVRANITSFLQAHGYASQRSLQSIGDATVTGEISSLQPGDSRRENTNVEPPNGSAGMNARGFTQNYGEAEQNRANHIIRDEADHAQRGHEQANASTDIPQVLHRPTPYNLRSLEDLYTQLPDQTIQLKRFGSEVFINRNLFSMSRGRFNSDTPLDVPVGPDYVIGSGDSLTINLWGGITQSITRQVDRNGQILLPEAGLLQVAGLPLERAESLITGALKRQYRDIQVSVTISRLRSVRVYIVGDVQRPGGYDISSLATPLSALYAAGGPTSVGSLRIVRHLRGKQLVEEVDLYDFLLHGVRKGSVRFESGDTLLVPPAGAQVAISGAVKRPAIYELKAGESTLASVIADAGGFTASASFNHIVVERIDANQQRETVTLKTSGGHNLQGDRAAIDTFVIKDGDRIHIAPILPYSERAIYLQGHVVRPGRIPYTEGMQLNDVLRSYQDMLPEPAAHGEIVRLVPPDLHVETISFNVPDVLIGNANLTLQPFDTIRIFGRYEIDTPTVTIHGEVLRPDTYPLSKGMTAAQLVRMAGGFKRDALLDSADLTSYRIEGGDRVDGQLTTVHIGAAVTGTDPNADVTLKPGDVLTIHQLTGWSEIGQSVTIQGQVRFPGNYGFREGERLSSVLRRAGGMRETAYAGGAVLIREQVRELEEKSRQELIRQIEANSAAARLGPAVGAGDTGGTLQLIKVQQEQALAQLKSHPATGRMVIHISADIDSWANTPADIELRRGDVLTIPKRPGFVLVTGQVYNATALTFTPGKTAAWYLSRAGGTNGAANRKEIFIIRANGSVVGRHSGSWFNDVLSTRLNPGDMVVVPQKIIGASLLWRNLLTTAQLASSIAITAGIAAAAL